MNTHNLFDRSKGTWFKAEDWETLTTGLPVYRGFSRPLTEDKMTIYAPVNRQPKNIPLPAHHRIDAWFTQQFGIPFRSRAVYGTGSLDKAQEHAGEAGEVALIRPNGDFSFCWSPNCYDLYGEYAMLDSDEQIEAMLEKLAFRAEALEQAIMSGYEIMLAADSFTVERVCTI